MGLVINLIVILTTKCLLFLPFPSKTTIGTEQWWKQCVTFVITSGNNWTEAESMVVNQADKHLI